MIAKRFFVLLVCGLLAGCTGLTDPWLGEWKGAEGRLLRFKADGKLEYESNGVTRATGTYTKLSSRAAKLELTSVDAGPSGAPVTKAQTVRMEDNGKTFDYNRVRFHREK